MYGSNCGRDAAYHRWHVRREHTRLRKVRCEKIRRRSSMGRRVLMLAVGGGRRRVKIENRG
jgi:hypothetical protein